MAIALGAMIAGAVVLLAAADWLDARWWTGHGEFAFLHVVAAVAAVVGAAVGWWVFTGPAMLWTPLAFAAGIYLWALNISPSRWEAFFRDARARLTGRTKRRPVPPPSSAWTSDEPLPELFRRVVDERLGASSNLKLQWEGPGADGKRTLRVARVDDEGYDVVIECLEHGLYPSAGEWIGPAWDARDPIGEVVEDMYRWLVSALSPEATLEVSYSNGRAYQWRHSSVTACGPFEFRTGILFFNYFGTRTTREFRNHHLPAPGVP